VDIRVVAALVVMTGAMQTTPARYLALGDSYTIGEGVADADRWPLQLTRALRDRQVDVGYPLIIAQTGWTTDELDSAMTAHMLHPPYDLVTLLIGVNNQYRRRSVEDYRAQFRALLERAAQLAGGMAQKVVVVSIPDWGVTPFNTSRDRESVAREIDAFNIAAREEAQVSGARWVDITDLTRGQPSAVVADGLHPSATMYGQWVERITPVALGILAR
jgi:lysophospholipase L1-like esterase